jgi:hypothetical protein
MVATEGSEDFFKQKETKEMKGNWKEIFRDVYLRRGLLMQRPLQKRLAKGTAAVYALAMTR